MTSAPDPWLEITVEVAGIDAEIAADLLRQACPGGVAIETPSRLDRETETYVPDGDATALVKGYFHPGPDADRVQQNMRLALQTAPLQRPAVWREPTLLADADWRDSWKRYFGVQRIGKHLVIVPSWEKYTPKPDDVVLRIDPGMAFGTGQHQTTAMCLAALEKVFPYFTEPWHAGEPIDVLDLGCGSGILAVAAAKLGATRVVALDTDPQAIKATIENAATNSVDIEAREGSIESPDEKFDIIVANISGLTLERLAPMIAGSLRKDGELIISGFLDESEKNLHLAFERLRVMWMETLRDGEWRAMIFDNGNQ